MPVSNTRSTEVIPSSVTSTVLDCADGFIKGASAAGTMVYVPAASFTASPTNGVVPFGVTFTDTSTGTITNRAWSFGDGGMLSTNGTSVMHTYNMAGTNTVRLIASGPVGVSTNNKPNLIVGINPADLAVTPSSRNFGSVTVGLTNTMTFSVINNGDVTLNGTATSAAPFVVTAGSPYAVLPHLTGTVSVAFAPVSAGAFRLQFEASPTPAGR